MHEIQPIRSTAVVVPRLGGPDVLLIRPWEVQAPASAEVRVQQEAAGISFADLLVMQGVHPERAKPPFVPGWDVLGTVDAVGPGVTSLKVGDRVAGLSIHGGWAEHVVLPVSRVAQVSADVDAKRAVCLAMDYIVAYQMLTRTAKVNSQNTVLVQGVGGGVGTAIMQVARSLGVHVLGTDRGSKRKHVEQMGGTLIDFESEDVVKRCKELTAGRGVDAAFDGIGATARTTLKAVRPGGTLVWFGMVTFLSGGKRDLRKIAKTAGTVLPVFAQNLIPGGKRTKLYSIQLLARKHPEWYQRDLTALLEMLDTGQIDPQVAAVWKLDEVPAALAKLARGALPGKQVIALSNSH